jgi:uncharacterized Zn finger protein
MPQCELEDLKQAIQGRWSAKPSDKARKYIGKFIDMTRIALKITAKVHGNYGKYNVAIQVENHKIRAACSCYVGADGHCHHCEALAHTFIQEEETFQELQPITQQGIDDLFDIRSFLQKTTLDSLLKELKSHGISQKDFAESIGMSTQHLSSVKSCELKQRHYHELGATKLACLWILDRLTPKNKPKKQIIPTR